MKKVKQRYIPLSDELWSYIKTYFYSVVLIYIIILFFTGISTYTIFGAVPLAMLFGFFAFILLIKATGVVDYLNINGR